MAATRKHVHSDYEEGGRVYFEHSKRKRSAPKKSKRTEDKSSRKPKR